MSATGPDERSAERADELLPEEQAAGSDDPRSQAAAVLAESDERAAARDGYAEGGGGPGAVDPVEHRRSEDTVEP